jgi:hypothetical protein
MRRISTWLALRLVGPPRCRLLTSTPCDQPRLPPTTLGAFVVVDALIWISIGGA